MSAGCARWPELRPAVEARLAGAEAAVLASAEFAHLDDCDVCRRAALALDPSLALRPLAEAPAAPPADQVEAMRLAVATLRRSGLGKRRAAPGWRVAASLLLATAALTQLPRLPGVPSLAEPPVELAVALPAGPPLAAVAEPASFPLVEDLDRPEARIYQLGGGGDLAIVMIVDESLDV